MTFATKASIIFATCLLLSGCIETLPTTTSNNFQSVESISRTNSVINGYFRSRIVVTDASGEIQQDTNINLSGDGRLSSQDYTLTRLSPIPPNAYGSYQYDENGNLTHHFWNVDGIVEIDKDLQYDADGRLVSTSETSQSGRQFVESYRYNASGQLVSRYRSTADEAPGSGYSRKFEYDSYGRLERLTKNAPSTPEPGDIVYFYYDENDRLIESHLDSYSDGGIDRVLGYSYDADGNVSHKTMYNSAGALSVQIEYSYTETEKRIFNETLFEMLYDPD